MPLLDTTFFTSPKQTLSNLRKVGYYTDEETARAVMVNYHANYPILIEGPAGAGKTELAEAVHRLTGMELITLQCYEGITDKDAVGVFNTSLQHLFVESNQGTLSWDEINEQINSRKFFLPGALLKSIESTSRCILLIDEIDKISYAFQAVLLQLLGSWRLSVPLLGTIPAATIPFVILTSNAEGKIGFPLRRRCQYLFVKHPPLDVEAEIIARQTPSLAPAVHRFLAGIADALRTGTYEMQKPPSISEIKYLGVVMELLGIDRIDANEKELWFPLLAKTEKDRGRLLMKQMFENIMDHAAKKQREWEQAQRLGDLETPISGSAKVTSTQSLDDVEALIPGALISGTTQTHDTGAVV